MTGFSSLDWNFAMRSRTALIPDRWELPDGERDGLSPGLRRPDAVLGGERLLLLVGFDVFLCSAAMRSDKLAPALGTGTALSPDLFGRQWNITVSIKAILLASSDWDLHDVDLTDQWTVNASMGSVVCSSWASL